jgi:hypothetical protein
MNTFVRCTREASMMLREPRVFAGSIASPHKAAFTGGEPALLFLPQSIVACAIGIVRLSVRGN